MAKKRRRIGEILQDMGLVTQAHIDEVLAQQKRDPAKKLAEFLIERNLVTPVQVGEALMEQWRERVEAYEGKSLVVKGIRPLLGEPKDIFELQRKLLDIMEELKELREDLESLYQVSLAIAKAKVFEV